MATSTATRKEKNRKTGLHFDGPELSNRLRNPVRLVACAIHTNPFAVFLSARKSDRDDIFQKTGLTNRRAIRQWDAISKSSPLHGRETILNTELNLGAMGQIARPVAENKAAEVRYKNVPQFPHLFTFGNRAFFQGGSSKAFAQQSDFHATNYCAQDIDTSTGELLQPFMAVTTHQC
ncbi:MAG: hypothetical protein ABI905_07255 [Betaproteobacteria bacterium]